MYRKVIKKVKTVKGQRNTKTTTREEKRSRQDFENKSIQDKQRGEGRRGKNN